MSEATQKQLELIAALGGFEGKDISKEEAGKIIGTARQRDIEPDWSKKDAVELKILQIMKMRDVAALKKATDAEDISDLEERIREWDEEIEDYKEDLKIEKEDARERIKYLHEDLQNYKSAKRLTKKPTKAEVKAAVEALDTQMPRWEQDKIAERHLVDTLYNNFKHLRTNKSRPKSGKGEKNESSSGCLLIMVLVCVVGWFVFNSSKSEDDEGTDAEGKQASHSSDTQTKEKPKAEKQILVEASRILWRNADEDDNMRLRFKLINKNPFPISNVIVKFKYYDVTDVKLEGTKTKTFEDTIKAGEAKQYDDYLLGSFPKDTMKIKAEIISFSPLK